LNKIKNKKIINERNECRVCFNKEIVRIIKLGKMPLAGAFIDKNELQKKELKIPLNLYYCSNCKLVQVKDSIDANFLFNNYNYSSSKIPSLELHFKNYAKKILNYFNKRKSIKILEFGCNDGVLLKEFKKYKKYFILGVDPSKNISDLAKKRGLNVINNYFNLKTSKYIDKKFGKFDYITGSNVFAHINDIHTVVKASKQLLKKNGLLVIEVHYLLDLISENQYDFFYHEHLNYYTISSLVKLFKIDKLKLIDVERIKIHGGSIRVTVTNNKSKIVSNNVREMIEKEKKVNLNFFNEFNNNIKKQKYETIAILNKLINSNKKIIGYGASGRGTIFLNYCKINNKYLEYIVDGSPLRAGKYMPGVKIPIYDLKYFHKNNKKIDYVLIIAWNYSEFIIKQVRKINNKIKFIIPFPFPTII
tara:strand:- start:5005 stop:6258 length:1254 start_codon:yes stop_codon:yes gene_type:complete